KKYFAELLDLALDVKLPVTIHSREAFQDTFGLTNERKIFQRIGGVIHCYTGNKEEARKFIDAGAYLSFSVITTIKKAEELREVVRHTPNDRFLIETDSPYLAPEPHRGKRNEPVFVARVAEVISQLKKLSLDEVAAMATENTFRLFRIHSN